VSQPFLDALTAFFYPGACPACLAASGDDALCAACARTVPAAPALAAPDALGGAPVVVACRYAGVVRDLVLRMKYGRESHPAAALGGLLAAALSGSGAARGADCLVPMPLSRRRLRQRGFNQAERLAAVAGRALGLPVLEKLLRRPVDRPPQAALGKEERAMNVRGVFRASDAAFGRAILLVDDVITTGHTMAAAVSALECAGARRVVPCAVAESGWPDLPGAVRST
jgi:ComF family protein